MVLAWEQTNSVQFDAYIATWHFMEVIFQIIGEKYSVMARASALLFYVPKKKKPEKFRKILKENSW